MTKHQTQIRGLVMLSLCLVLGLSACSTTAYKAPINQFNEASTVVVETSRAYINDVNKVERDKYVQDQIINRKQITLIDIQTKQLLTPDEIELRLKALSQLTQYSNLLVKIANSDAPESITQNAESLGKAIEKLNADVSKKLGRPENANFKAAVGPVTTLIGEVARFAAERKIQQALDKAVREGEKPVKKLLEVLSTETSAAYERKRSYLSRMRTIAVDAYNTELGKGSNTNTDTLNKYADQIKAQLDKWDTFAAANPQEGIASMSEAHSSLVSYVNSHKTPKDLADFIAEMERFLERAKIVGKAVKELSEL